MEGEIDKEKLFSILESLRLIKDSVTNDKFYMMIHDGGSLDFMLRDIIKELESILNGH